MENSFNTAPSNLQEVLEELGYKLVNRGLYWHSNAAFRQGDNRTALQIWKNSGVWRDFVENTPPLPFVKLLEAHFGTEDDVNIKKYSSGEGSFRPTVGPTVERLTMDKIYDDSILDELFPHYHFYNDKGISSPILEFLRGGLATKGQMYQRFVFPIYNEHLQIHGFSGRDMAGRDPTKVPKWKHLGKKRNWIYPYYVEGRQGEGIPVQRAISESRRVILIESIGDLLNLHQHDHYNALVTFGLDISPKLLCHLSGLDLDRIIIAFNNDSEKAANRGARAAVKSYLKLLTHFDLEQLSICLPVKNDFGDMASGDFVEWEKKLGIEPTEKAPAILEFAEKLAANKELPSTYLKNLKILRAHVS